MAFEGVEGCGLHGLIEYNSKTLNQNPQTETSAVFHAGKYKRPEKAILTKLLAG